jgi:choline-glycine betaine transporter
LGLGTLQIGAGFDETFGITNAIGLQLIIAVTAAGYMISASTPISKGVNYLSQASIYLAGVFLLVYFLVAGRTVTQINAFI